MKPMRILGLLLSFGALVCGQTQPGAAPAKVDKALRARVQEFYQTFVDGKPRLADRLVAEDSKDIFFTAAKPRYYGCEVFSIKYSENFTKAVVTMSCEEDVIMVGAGKQRLKAPQVSRWKLMRGKWYWHVDTETIEDTPFGPMKRTARAGDSQPLALPKGPSPTEVTNMVSVDKTEVRLSSTEASSDTVVVTNGMPGWIKLDLELPRDVPGFEAKVDKPDVQLGQKAAILFHYEPKGKLPKDPVTVNIVVQPTDKIIPVHVVFSAPNGN